MSAASIVHDWRRTVAAELLPQPHGHQARARADLGLAVAGSCQAGQLASHVPAAAQRPGPSRRSSGHFLVPLVDLA